MPEILPVPGDVVWIRRQRWRVERATRDRHLVRLDVAWQRRRRTFLGPFDIVRHAGPAGSRRVRSQEALARLAGTIARAPDHRIPLALLDADAEILPHQMEPALAIIAGSSRVLIADEVGLGKTIQAGLIVAELVRRQPAPRILIVVPASLREQWHGELLARFSIDSRRAGRYELERIAAEGSFGANPWSHSGVWLVSADFVKQAHVLGSLPIEPWDLLVIDEAHGVCGDSDRYAACHRLAQRSRRILLLTATPHSGDDARFDRLAGLGAAEHGDAPLVFQRTRTQVGLPRNRKVRWHSVRLHDAEVRALSALIAFERVALRAAGPDGREHTRLLLSVLRKRALSTFAALSRSIARRLLWLGHADRADAPDWTQAPLRFNDDPDDDSEEQKGLTAPGSLTPQHERRWLIRLRRLAEEASRCESKVRRLAALIEHTREPVIVFSEFRDSLEAVASSLRRSRSISLLHGGQDTAEQRDQLRRYLSGPASVLLATDVAGQGLNLQSRGRWVISLELPWNPARLEQRIGRVDRLGQPRATHFTLLIADHETERGLLSHLARRVLCAQTSFSRSVLDDLAPPEVLVRARLLEQPEASTDTSEPETAPTHEPVQLARGWRRAGATVARALRRRRQLKDLWRGQPGDGHTAVYARLRRGCRLLSCGIEEPTKLVVLAVPIVNGRDELVEKCHVVLKVSDHFTDGIPAGLIASTRELIEARLRRRLTRLSRALAQASVSLSRRERRNVEIIRRALRPSEGQPGLFDSRELHVHLARAADVARLESLSERKIEELRDAAVVRLGEIEIAYVLEPGR